MSGPADARVRDAVPEDVPAIVALLADDELGRTREDPADLAPYAAAFAEIAASAHATVLVAERGGAVVGCLELCCTPSLTRGATRRATIEGVRVAADERGRGTGRRLVADAIVRARTLGCGLVQLTTDRRRPDARRFYEALGFAASHDGMKLAPDARADGPSRA